MRGQCADVDAALGANAATIISQFMQSARRTAKRGRIASSLVSKQKPHPTIAIQCIAEWQNQELAAAAHTWLANARGHSNDSSMALSSARRQQHNHRDKCDEQYNFHEVAPSSLLGATARKELQRMRIVYQTSAGISIGDLY
jgi:hypothetical protein